MQHFYFLRFAFVINKKVCEISIENFCRLSNFRQEEAVWGSNKLRYRKKAQIFTMNDPEIESQLAPLRAIVKEQVKQNL